MKGQARNVSNIYTPWYWNCTCVLLYLSNSTLRTSIFCTVLVKKSCHSKSIRNRLDLTFKTFSSPGLPLKMLDEIFYSYLLRYSRMDISARRNILYVIKHILTCPDDDVQLLSSDLQLYKKVCLNASLMKICFYREFSHLFITIFSSNDKALCVNL